MEKKIAFLFGAGISDPNGILGIGTNELTEKILDGKDIFRDGTGRYLCNVGNQYIPMGGEEYVNRIKKLFIILRHYFGDHYSFMNREINYEDYYYLINSIHKDEWGEIENPVVTYFSETLFKTHALLFEPVNSNFSSIRLIDLTSEALNYIKYMVVDSLDKKPNSFDHFNFLKNLAYDIDFDKAFIFTLNHDTFIEQYFNKEQIDFIDGFINKDISIKKWTPESYDNELKMNLFKLHGSINWDIYDPNDDYKKNVCIYSGPQRDTSDPLITIGSFNKLNEYSRGINFELQYLLWKYLNQCDRLVISGYSFGDQGINSRIINWLYKSQTKKIIIIHGDKETLKKNVRQAIYKNWDGWIKKGILKIIPKWIQETNWQEMKTYLE